MIRLSGPRVKPGRTAVVAGVLLWCLVAGAAQAVVTGEPAPVPQTAGRSACSRQLLLLRAQLSSQRAVIDKLRLRVASLERRGVGTMDSVQPGRRAALRPAASPSSSGTSRMDTLKLWKGLGASKTSLLQIGRFVKWRRSETVPVASPEVREAAFRLRRDLLAANVVKTEVVQSRRINNPCEWPWMRCDDNGTSIVSIHLSDLGEMETLPDDVFSGSPGVLGNVRDLYMARNRLRALPESVTNLKGLQTLNIEGNRLLSLPEWIGKLRTLQRLYAGSNRLSSLHESIVNLKSLSWLYIEHNRLVSLPQYIGDLKSIEAISLAENHVSSLPESLGKLKNLRRFECDNNRLSSLPESIGNLKSLTNLKLAHNRLMSLPQSIGHLKGLSRLDLDGNKLVSVPESIGELERLRALDINSNRLSSLPESIGNLKRLTKLSLSGNRLTSLPASFGNLESLDNVVMNFNRLTALPESMGKLQNLRRLDVYRNKLLSLPESIGNLTSLTRLTAHHNRLSSLPESIGNLRRLTELSVFGNRLVSLPESIGNLDRIVDLTLSYNELSSLPEAFGNLKGLKWLMVNANRLTSLPESFGSLKGLESLDANHNGLLSLPESIGNLTNLLHIDLSGNQLSSLPESIGRLTNIRRFDMSSNRLSQVPESLGKLKKIRKLLLQHNMIQRLPREWGSRVMGEVYVGYNHLSELPEWVGRIQVPVLDASHNVLNKLPKFRNSNMISLSLEHNHIAALPPGVFKGLTRVEMINLSHNHLSQIPESMVQNCEGLTTLDLSGNALTSIPYSVMTTAKLRVLEVFDNRISVVHESFWRWVMMETALELSIENNPLKLSEADAVDVMQRKIGGSLYIDRKLLPEGTDMTQAAQRILGAAEGSAPVEWTQSSDVTTSGHGEACIIMQAVHPEAVVKFFVRQCECVDTFYWNAAHSECVTCPPNAVCRQGSVECFEGYHLWQGTDAAVKCVACHSGVRCENNQAHPRPGQWWDLSYVGPPQVTTNSTTRTKDPLGLWAYQREGSGPPPGSSFVHSCRNEDACHGGDDVGCSEGYEGKLCSICSDGYYSSSHGVCEKCPALAMTVVYFSAGVVTFTITLVAVFMRASVLAGKSAGELIRIGMSPLHAAVEALTAAKILVSFLQVVVALDVVFDVEWPRVLRIADEVFGWVNLDWLKSSSLECLWEHGGMASGGSSVTALLSFSYYTRLCLSSGFPLFISFLLLVLFGVIQVVLRTAKLEHEGRVAPLLRGMSLRCLQSHLLLWTFIYLPVSSRAFGFFLCDSFDGGRTHWLHDDLSIECYTDTYYQFMPVAGLTLGVYTLGFPLFVVGAFAVQRLQKRRGRSMPMLPGRSPIWIRAIWGEALRTLSGPYKDHLGYWDAVEMARKVLVCAAAIHFGSTPTFQLTVALMISFVAAVVHFYYQPFKAALSNRLAGLNLILVYFTMSLGLLRRLDVSESKRMAFGGAVLAMDVLFCAVLISVIMWDIGDSVRRHGYSALTRAARRVTTLCNASKRLPG